MMSDQALFTLKSQNDIELAVAYTRFAHLYLHNNETWISSCLPLKNCAVYRIAPHRGWRSYLIHKSEH